MCEAMIQITPLAWGSNIFTQRTGSLTLEG